MLTWMLRSPALPTALHQALDLLEGSKVAKDAFGDDVIEHYLHAGRLEVREFDAAVTDWERRRYFETHLRFATFPDLLDMRLIIVLLFLLGTLSAEARDLLPDVRRIVFLGDSITHSGQYVDGVEAYLFAAYPDRQWQVINVGLPSETVSGLSEEGHADGKFPRPDAHERLDRVLEKTKPDLIFACYGMNDGIYLPLSEERFARFRKGIEQLRAKAAAAGAQVIHLTPPVFDAEPIAGKTSADGVGKPFQGYDNVLTKYSEWLLSQRENGWRVIDIHGPMRTALDERRQKDPGFRFANDGVHPSDEGHWVMTRALIQELESDRSKEALALLERLLSSEPPGPEYRRLVRERGRLLTDAWLTETGHQRPGMSRGLPLSRGSGESRGVGGGNPRVSQGEPEPHLQMSSHQGFCVPANWGSSRSSR